jgi:hypothetical protein
MLYNVILGIFAGWNTTADGSGPTLLSLIAVIPGRSSCNIILRTIKESKGVILPTIAQVTGLI